MLGLWATLWNFRSSLILVLLPLLFLPLPIVLRSSEAACGYCIIVMAGYWISECLPLAVTSFLPLILFPLMGIMSADEVSVVYFKDANWLFIGGLILAVGVEYTKLHRRIALSVLLLVGTSPQSLMLGFMLPTYVLSMWISNTATTAMMIPIVNAVLSELRKEEVDFKNSEEPGSDTLNRDTKNHQVADECIELEVTKVTGFANSTACHNGTKDKENQKYREIVTEICNGTEKDVAGKQEANERIVVKKPTLTEIGLTVCVPYAATIGGITTLTGTGSNLVLAGQYLSLFPDAEPAINFGNWMAYHLPISLLMLGLTYLWLMWLYLGIQCVCFPKKKTEQNHRIRHVIKNEYSKLGKIRWNEITMIIILTTTVLLWFFRDPGYMPGWSVLFKEDFVSDGTVAMTMAILLFILPSKRPTFLGKRPDDPTDIGPVPAVVDWKSVASMVPWGVVFLSGGGFALAKGATTSGFSKWLSLQLAVLGGIPPWLVCLVVTVITCLFTECTSNIATASLFIPIISQLAQVLEVHPLYFLLPTVVATSLAFMLPVATPPNAIAFSYGYLKVIDLVKSGWLLNVFGVLILMIFVNSYASVIYNVEEFPEWASLNYTG